jgi:hypothetical protein
MMKAGGIITLADIYCLFNRARGTELISPDDLLQAVGLFSSYRAGMHQRTFPSGVVVVQSDSHDDNEVPTTLPCVGPPNTLKAVHAPARFPSAARNTDVEDCAEIDAHTSDNHIAAQLVVPLQGRQSSPHGSPGVGLSDWGDVLQALHGIFGAGSTRYTKDRGNSRTI